MIYEQRSIVLVLTHFSSVASLNIGGAPKLGHIFIFYCSRLKCNNLTRFNCLKLSKHRESLPMRWTNPCVSNSRLSVGPKPNLSLQNKNPFLQRHKSLKRIALSTFDKSFFYTKIVYEGNYETKFSDNDESPATHWKPSWKFNLAFKRAAKENAISEEGEREILSEISSQHIAGV